MFRPTCEIYICLSCLYEFPQQNQRPWESISFLCLYYAHFVPFVLICTFGFYLYITKFWFHKSRIKNSFLRKDYWQKRLKMVFGVFGIHEEVSLCMIKIPIRHPNPFLLLWEPFALFIPWTNCSYPSECDDMKTWLISVLLMLITVLICR